MENVFLVDEHPNADKMTYAELDHLQAVLAKREQRCNGLDRHIFDLEQELRRTQEAAQVDADRVHEALLALGEDGLYDD